MAWSQLNLNVDSWWCNEDITLASNLCASLDVILLLIGLRDLTGKNKKQYYWIWNLLKKFVCGISKLEQNSSRDLQIVRLFGCWVVVLQFGANQYILC